MDSGRAIEGLEICRRIRTGNGPAAMARVRNFAISALRLGGHDNIARATRYYSRHLDKVAELLAPKVA